jgi:hypothetical protein
MGSFFEGELHLVMDANFSNPIDYHLLFLSLLSSFIFLSSCFKEIFDGHFPSLVTS